VFRIPLGGALTVLHSFAGDDGAGLLYRLTQGRDGNLYGSTDSGGSGINAPRGTAFRITLDGALTTLHVFDAFFEFDGAGSWIQGVDGNYYGTAGTCGGCLDAGAAYRMDADGNVQQIAGFSGIDPSLGVPGPLVQGFDGNFYGVAVSGGQFFRGGVFRMTPSGQKVELKSFTDVPPSYDALIQASDMHFYGTANGCDAAGCHGYVFQMDANGATRQIGPTIVGSQRLGYTVSGLSGLIQGRDGNLYGTTRGDATHAGTVFRISSFAPCVDATRVSYDNGTLNMGFTVMTTRPATWKTWLAAPGPPEQSKLLWSVGVPVIPGPVSVNVPIPNFPPIGDVFVLTALQTPQGILCADWKLINAHD
jgi:uncharacterized repeat protein (TIGR03803 family)